MEEEEEDLQDHQAGMVNTAAATRVEADSQAPLEDRPAVAAIQDQEAAVQGPQVAAILALQEEEEVTRSGRKDLPDPPDPPDLLEVEEVEEVIL